MQILLPVVALVFQWCMFPFDFSPVQAAFSQEYFYENGEHISLPNAFSPNQDGINDTFQADFCNLNGFSILVLDDRGDVLFSSEQPDFAWDGTDVQGKAVAEGVYTFEVKGMTPGGNLFEENGTVVLVR